jgi:hypothetical protein
MPSGGPTIRFPPYGSSSKLYVVDPEKSRAAADFLGSAGMGNVGSQISHADCVGHVGRTNGGRSCVEHSGRLALPIT